VVLYALVKLIEGIVFALRARTGGWAVYGNGKEGIWVRTAEPWGRWSRKVTGKLGDDEVREVDEGMEERSGWVWRGVREAGVGERRPLLG